MSLHAVLSAAQKTASHSPALELHTAYSCERLCWCLGLNPGPLEKHWLPRSMLGTSYSTWKLQRKHGLLMIHKQRGSAASEFIVEEKILLVTMKVLVALHRSVSVSCFKIPSLRRPCWLDCLGVAADSPRRHSLTANSLTFSPLQSFCLLHHHHPCALVQEICCWCTSWDWPLELPTLVTCDVLHQSPFTAKRGFFDEG